MHVTGMICIWSGSIESIPSGWAYCDGTNGTPDLRDKFPVCAGPLLPYLSTKSSLTHSHDVDLPSHSHSLPPGSGVGVGGELSASYDAESVEGSTVNKVALPNWKSLAFIMRL